MRCRGCCSELDNPFLNLGMTPLANSYVSKENLDKFEVFYPLRVFVCKKCFFVQLPEYEKPENIFTEYAYFSSFSSTWVAHLTNYAENMIKTLSLSGKDLVIEIASNDGILLEQFKKEGIKVLGIEPARNVAEYAKSKNIPTRNTFFNKSLALELIEEKLLPSLLIANNVLAHVPDINDFVEGISLLLEKSKGVATLEFPHLLNLLRYNQFDTIYHEHYSYLSITSLKPIFKKYNLTLFRIDRIPTHGGSLRIYLSYGEKEVDASVFEVEQEEVEFGIRDLDTYRSFSKRVRATKVKLLSFILEKSEHGLSIAAYGAPAKGNTLLNYCGIGPEFIEFTVDKNPVKQGKFLPGTRIPILSPEAIVERNPDLIFILPWNIKNEIIKELREQGWRGKTFVAIPEVEVYEV